MNTPENPETTPARNWKASVKKHWKGAAIVTTLVVAQTVLLVRFRKAGLATMAQAADAVTAA